MLLEEFYQQQSTILAHPNWVSSASIPGYAYPGGKKRLRKTIVGFMPQRGDTYAEPFAGRGNVFWLAASALQYSHWHLNDLRTAPFFEAILTHGNTIQVPEHTREEFERNKIASMYGDPIAALLEPYLTFSGAGYAAGYRSAIGSPTQAGYERTLRSAHQILIQTQPQITSLDWKCAASELGQGDFAFYDPPYLGAKVHGYGVGDLDHAELVAELKNAKYRWLLSEYHNPLYVDAFGPPFWTKNVQLCSTNFLHNRDHGRARRVECLWRNF